jgi:hypothetical protein
MMRIVGFGCKFFKKKLSPISSIRTIRKPMILQKPTLRDLELENSTTQWILTTRLKMCSRITYQKLSNRDFTKHHTLKTRSIIFLHHHTSP